MITLSVDDFESNVRLIGTMLSHIDPSGTHLTSTTAAKALALLEMYPVEVLFLDIEMPDVNGIAFAQQVQKQRPEINIIFVTGHPEYAYPAHGVHCSGFLTKPVEEEDIRAELKHLRFPLAGPGRRLTVRCSGGFALFHAGRPFDFDGKLTTELFAYLVYRNGAICTNGELLGVFWDGNPDKSGRLRQLIMEMRENLRRIDAEDVIIKKYGKLGLAFHLLEIIGDPKEIGEQFNWND